MTAAMTAPLPEFVIIGAVKAATTWMRDQLDARPDCYLPEPEPHFFTREFERGEAYYRETWFAGQAPGVMVGEKSADYLHDPLVPARMHAMIPNAKLIVQLRNPIDRAYSDYCMLFRRGTVDGDIGRYLGGTNNDQPRFLNDGLYFKNLTSFLEFYPQEQIHVILQEDIKPRAQEIVAEACRFLGLPELAEPVGIVPNANVKDAPLLPLPIRTLLAPAKRLVAPYRNSAWFRALRDPLAREVAYPALPDALRARMRDFYASDVEQLGRLIGRNLDHWLELPADRKARAAAG